VLAYIEAKHTLVVEGDEGVGQSLAKATKQIEAFKAIARPAVEHRAALGGITLGADFSINTEPGFPATRNPYYAAIWARHLKSKKAELSASYRAFSERLSTIAGGRTELPDMIVAGGSLALPAVRKDQNVELKPFLCETTELVTILNDAAPWGVALAHLLWAIEWIRLSDLPWPGMLAEPLQRKCTISAGNVPIRGSKFSRA
jgi:hypothetical protein